ncbi:MAG TPA: diguanylate cyclase, partial [Myxococcales bacterium]|nr:diguanylate cyclase [Myxococcales bacterium]
MHDQEAITHSPGKNITPRFLIFSRQAASAALIEDLLTQTQARPLPPIEDVRYMIESKHESIDDTGEARFPMPSFSVSTVYDVQEIFTSVMQANMDGMPYLALFFDLFPDEPEAHLKVIEQLCGEQYDIHVLLCMSQEAAQQKAPMLTELVGHKLLHILRKPLLEFEVSQTVSHLIAQEIEQVRLWENDIRFACAARGSSDGVWDWNLNTNDFFVSRRWKEMLGYRDDEISNVLHEWFQLVHHDDRKDLRAKLMHHIQEGEGFFVGEYRILHKDGTYSWMLCRGRTVRGATDRSHHLIGTQTDISEYKAIQEQQQHDVLHDPLTGLPNRTLFLDRLEQAMVRGQQRKAYQFAVLILDLDRFKTILDSLGHSVGDQLLIDVGQRFSRLISPTDTIARLGGSEYAILLDDANGLERAPQLAERIQQSLTLPFNLSGQEVFTGANIGIASNKKRYEHPEELLRDADSAMNKAKDTGKARVEMFVTDMHVQAVTLLQMETDLRRAIERKEFRMVYQPIVSLQNGQIIGFEALVRWYKSERVAISPASFIPVAEDTGLIIPIGKWVLEESCRQMQAWRDMFFQDLPLSVNVNLSSHQFAQDDLIEQIEETLRTSGVSGKHIKLELTESVLMDSESAHSVKKVFDKLKELDILLCMDDFGTGYSSLSYLHKFPFHTLKIDRSFIKRMRKDAKHAEIVRTIISLAQNLHMKVVAEGVETTEQLADLRELGCDYG